MPQDRSSLTTEQVVAVQRALEPQSQQQRTDIVIESILVILSTADQSEQGLHRRLHDLWPGARLTEPMIEGAIRTAKAMGLIYEVQGLHESLLTVAPTARTSPASLPDPLEVAKQQVSRYAETEYRSPLSDTQAQSLTNVAIDALAAAIREAFSAYSGNVSQPSNVALMPISYDLEAAKQTIESSAVDPATQEILMAFCLEAFDPSSDNGTALVTALATGYIMHAIVARRDQAAQTQIVGDLTSQWLLIDTPLLFTLLSFSQAESSLDATLQAALNAGMHVIIPQGCLDEVSEYVTNVEDSGEADAISRTLTDTRTRDALYQFTDNIALSSWLSHVAAGRSLTWDEFCKQAHSLGSRLQQRGYTVRELTGGGAEDPAPPSRCRQALHDEMRRLRAERGPSFRAKSDAAIYVDAGTMSMAWKQRLGRRHTDTFWPGAWIVTPDRRINPAFRALDRDDEFDLTISAPQLAHLLANFARASPVQELATSAARLLANDTLVQVASRYPPKMAAEMARSLAGVEGSTGVDIRKAQQMDINDVLGDLDIASDDADQKMASTLLAERANRIEELSKLEVERLDAVRRQAEERTDELRSQLTGLHNQLGEEQRRSTERERALRDEIDSLSNDLKDATNAIESERNARVLEEQKTTVRRRRVVLIAAGFALILLGLGVWWIFANVAFAIIGAVAGVWTPAALWEWSEQPDARLRTFVPRMVVESIVLSMSVLGAAIYELVQR